MIKIKIYSGIVKKNIYLDVSDSLSLVKLADEICENFGDYDALDELNDPSHTYVFYDAKKTKHHKSSRYFMGNFSDNKNSIGNTTTLKEAFMIFNNKMKFAYDLGCELKFIISKI